MKRTIAVLLALMMLISSFAACSNGGNTTTTAPANATQPASGSTPENTPAQTDKVLYAGHGLDSDMNPKATVHRSTAPPGFSVTAVPDTLIGAFGGEPSVLYPQGQSHSASGRANLPIYESLVHFNSITNEIEPRIAERWEQIDELTIRFYLHKGIKCHAGYEFTTKDVLWTARQGVASTFANYIWYVFDVENWVIHDDYTMDIKTFAPFAPALTYLSNTSVGPLVNQQAYEEQTPEEYARNPTGGTGPYRFVEWIAGDRIIYERFEDYYGEKPYFKNYILRNISDDVSRALSLEAGEIDFAYYVDDASCEAIINSDTANLVTVPSYQMILANFNLQIEPLNDIRVRKAMRYALDVDNIVNLAFSGMAVRADGLFMPSLSAYTPVEPDEEQYTYDIEKAKALMIEAGYPNGFNIDLGTSDTTAWVHIVEMLQNAWAQIGITCNVSITDNATMLAKQTNQADFEVMVQRYSSANDEPELWRTRLYSGGPTINNPGQYSNPRFDELMDLARESSDEAFRMECFKEVQKISRADLPFITLACPMMTFGVRSTLKGVMPHPYGTSDPRYIRPITEE